MIRLGNLEFIGLKSKIVIDEFYTVICHVQHVRSPLNC